MSNYCESCGAKVEYRLVKGTSYEGISIREVFLDEHDNIIDWNPEPAYPCEASVKEVIEGLIEVFKDLDNMLEATKKPVLDEGFLEMNVPRQ